MPTPAPEETIAAVDLGSNSFHMIVARLQDGHVRVLDRLREPVRLAAGLDERNQLSDEARARALDCLARFGQRLRDLPEHAVRAVGTNTLRRAHSNLGFLAEAETALGHPIEIISGVEEARLIYLGVSQSLADDGGRRLVMDIGGGSTELIVGERFECIHLESLYMGCVSMSRRFFGDGRIDKERMKEAETAARLELRPVQGEFRRAGWNSAVGASGTIRAVREVVINAGWCEHGITKDALGKLRKALISAGQVDDLKLKGLSDDRKPVFPGGVAILYATFQALHIEHMRVAQGALREGLLYDLIGRIRHEDVRERTVQALLDRWQVERDHAQRVAATAALFLEQARNSWSLWDEVYDEWLRWAALLHECGLAIAHSHYNRHGAYLLQHGELAGFSFRDQSLLATLVRGHRRKLRQEVFDDLPQSLSKPARRLCILLRLAVLLHRSRSPRPLPEVQGKFSGSKVQLRFPEGWLEGHPLTRADLEVEKGYLEGVGIKLDFK